MSIERLKNLQFGQVTEPEFGQLISLYRQLHPEDPFVSHESGFAVFKNILSSDHFFLLGAKIGDTLVGSTYVNVIPNITRGTSPYAVIENVITSTDRQNQGIGKGLMKYTLDFIWNKGCYKAMLMTGSKRESVHAFYRSCGFDGTAKYGYAAYPTTQHE